VIYVGEKSFKKGVTFLGSLRYTIENRWKPKCFYSFHLFPTPFIYRCR